MKYGTELAEMVENGKIKVENSQETALNEMEKKRDQIYSTKSSWKLSTKIDCGIDVIL